MEVGPDGAYGQLVPNPVDLERKLDHEAARNRGLNMAGKCVQERSRDNGFATHTHVQVRDTDNMSRIF